MQYTFLLKLDFFVETELGSGYDTDEYGFLCAEFNL